MNLYENINDWWEHFLEQTQEDPHYAKWIVIVLTSFWLLGVICGWKWTYETSTWNQNNLRDMLGEKMYRICVGALLVVILILSMIDL